MVIALVKVALNFAVVTKPSNLSAFHSKGVLFCSAGLFNPRQEGTVTSPEPRWTAVPFTGLCGSKEETGYFSTGFFSASTKKGQLLLLPIFFWSELVTWPSSVERRMIQLPLWVWKEKRMKYWSILTISTTSALLLMQ